MYHGKLVEVGQTEQIVHEPEHDYTRVLIGAAPDPSRRVKRTKKR